MQKFCKTIHDEFQLTSAILCHMQTSTGKQRHVTGIVIAILMS